MVHVVKCGDPNDRLGSWLEAREANADDGVEFDIVASSDRFLVAQSDCQLYNSVDHPTLVVDDFLATGNSVGPLLAYGQLYHGLVEGVANELYRKEPRNKGVAAENEYYSAKRLPWVRERGPSSLSRHGSVWMFTDYRTFKE